MNVNEAHNENSSQNEELIERMKVEGSPFHVIGSIEHGYFLAFGKYRLTQPLGSKEEVITHLAINQYEIIMKMVSVMITISKDMSNGE